MTVCSTSGSRTRSGPRSPAGSPRCTRAGRWPTRPGRRCRTCGGMGASPDVQDVFVQVDYLTGSDGHSHLPARSALQCRGNGAAQRRAATISGQGGRLSVHLCRRGSARSTCTSTWARTTSLRRPSIRGACGLPATWTPDCAIVPAALSKGGNSESARRRARRVASPPRARAAPSRASQAWWAGRAGSGPIVTRWSIAPTARLPAAQDRRAASRGCRGRGRTSSTTRSSLTRSGTGRPAIRPSRGATRASPTRAVAI